MTFQRWTINRQSLPRNPDDFTYTDVQPNVSYDKLATGTQVRMQPKRLRSARQVQLVWHNADERLRNSIMKYVGNGQLVKVQLSGMAPPREMYAYLDSPLDAMSKDILDQRSGQGGTRRDLTISGQTDGPWVHSYNNVPNTMQSSSQIFSWFNGPLNSSYDNLPIWNGVGWSNSMSVGSITMSNLGTHPWSPVIALIGPFANFVLNVAYQDVDGTGAGVNFTWLGTPVANGDYVLFDTETLRCYWSVSGVLNPTNAFSVTERASGNPFPFWPDAPSGNFTINILTASGTSSGSAIDYSNAARETFRYF